MGTTSTSGLPYPEESDAIASWPAVLADLAQLIDVDTGWVQLTSAVAGLTIHYRAGLRYCTVRVSGSAAAATNIHITLVTAANGLPAAYRPTGSCWGGAFIAGVPGVIGINPDGSILAHQDSGAQASSGWGVQFTFPIK